METTRPRDHEKAKRACNECRQQKLRCDVVKEPFSSCSRCRRLRLVCKIDPSFKRVEKRKSKLDRLQLADIRPQPSSAETSAVEVQSAFAANPHSIVEIGPSPGNALPTLPTRLEDLPSVTGLPEASQLPTQPTISQYSPDSSGPHQPNQSVFEDLSQYGWKLDGVHLSDGDVHDLFKEFFEHYHPFLPFLNPSKPPIAFFKNSRLLFWTIVAIASRRYTRDLTLLTSLSSAVPRLMWSTLQSVSQNYHDVKALCLLCTWPFPLSSSSRDCTFMLGGTMIHLAMQMGLHVPGRAQDFSQFRLQISEEEVQDRIMTWNIVKVVSQTLATSYGQPSITPFALQAHPDDIREDGPLDNLKYRLHIERFCHRVTNSLQHLPSVTRGTENPEWQEFESLKRDVIHLELALRNSTANDVIAVYAMCAKLHLHLFALFDCPTTPDYVDNLKMLHEVCEALLYRVSMSEKFMKYCPKYVFWMTLAAAFTICKLLSSTFADYLDVVTSKQLFNTAVSAIRQMSVSNNDLAGRLAEVLVQLRARATQTKSPGSSNNGWQSLGIKVRSRMSVSITYDSLWEWRNGFLPWHDAKDATSPLNQPSSILPTGKSPSNFHNNALSSITTPQNFDLTDLIFDDLYPMNYIVENAGATGYF
ncbi:uncharacterized protein PAC_00218 [Phialocephala subalpina]|uniref:Zn(2)-C6 fungal-type domain-containing protein n=1 Tax=Phialocephala subalpina TaxID=576137 RepID=A0A1L7WC29_9HELO|nr:uncharacterized protein PAC_00218 [Phialocephala subalpina]